MNKTKETLRNRKEKNSINGHESIPFLKNESKSDQRTENNVIRLFRQTNKQKEWTK